ncbi:hypothetical protein E4U53_002742 [Claviceps sorghi]|nr:hypothetical protein E4U53_002742 [Claviceps sorghi]
MADRTLQRGHRDLVPPPRVYHGRPLAQESVPGDVLVPQGNYYAGFPAQENPPGQSTATVENVFMNQPTSTTGTLPGYQLMPQAVPNPLQRNMEMGWQGPNRYYASGQSGGQTLQPSGVGSAPDMLNSRGNPGAMLNAVPRCGLTDDGTCLYCACRNTSYYESPPHLFSGGPFSESANGPPNVANEQAQLSSLEPLNSLSVKAEAVPTGDVPPSVENLTYTHCQRPMFDSQPDGQSLPDQDCMSMFLAPAFTSDAPRERTSVDQLGFQSAEHHDFSGGWTSVDQLDFHSAEHHDLPEGWTLVDHDLSGLDQPAVQPGQATLPDEQQSSADTARNLLNNDPPSRSQTPLGSPPIPPIRVTQAQADKISRVIDEGIRKAYRRGLLRSNSHINHSLQLDLERNETIAWNRVIGLEGQDSTIAQNDMGILRGKIASRMNQCYNEVQRLPGAETGEKRGKRKQDLGDDGTTATRSPQNKKTGREMETKVKTEPERKDKEKKKKRTPGVVQAAAKRGGKSRRRGAGAASCALGDGQPRTRIYSHGGTDFTSQLCSDGVWRIVNVQKKTGPDGQAAEAVPVAGAGNDGSGGAA